MSQKAVKTAGDFSVGNRRLKSYQVAGSIIATIIGGASTLGTAQHAFQQGISAMWFTLGSSIACIFLGMFIAGPLRREEIYTVTEYLSKSYGERAGVYATVMTSLAIFIHIVGQVLSAVAIITSIFVIDSHVAVLIAIALMLSYIYFGGFLGTSTVGIIKTVLLYFTLVICGGLIYTSSHGMSDIASAFPVKPWFDFFSGGALSSIAQGFSLVVGITSTQSYLQALFSGKDVKESVKGAYISAFLIPPVGILCTIIGLFMRSRHPALIPGHALPDFILLYLNPVLGGITIAALIISVISTGSGLTLGICTMFSRDIYSKYIKRNAEDKEQLRVMRISVFAVLAAVAAIVFSNMDSLILEWAFLSMTLRGTTIFVPLIAAIYFKDKISKKSGQRAIVLAPSIALLWSFFGIKSIDPLYVGIASSLIIALLPVSKTNAKKQNRKLYFRG